MSTVFIAFQTNDDTRPIIEAVLADNPHAVLDQQPAMVKINAEGQLVIKRASIEERLGRPFDLQELQVNLITLSGNLDEDDDQFTLAWRN
jgi:phenol hydroxylase P2 protein